MGDYAKKNLSNISHTSIARLPWLIPEEEDEG